MKMVLNLIDHHHLMIKKILFLLNEKLGHWLSSMVILSIKGLLKQFFPDNVYHEIWKENCLWRYDPYNSSFSAFVCGWQLWKPVPKIKACLQLASGGYWWLQMGTRKLVSVDHKQNLFTSLFIPSGAQLSLKGLFAKRNLQKVYMINNNTQSNNVLIKP